MLTTCIAIWEMTVDWAASPNWSWRKWGCQKQIIFSKAVLHVLNKETELNGRETTCDLGYLTCRFMWKRITTWTVWNADRHLETRTSLWWHLSVFECYGNKTNFYQYGLRCTLCSPLRPGRTMASVTLLLFLTRLWEDFNNPELYLSKNS